MKILLSSAYLAPVEYYAILFNDENIIVEKFENYIKQSYRNRCTILSSNGVLSLSIPVESMGGQKCCIKDIKIAEHGNWQHIHWNAIVSAYNSTPFFEYYEDYFRPFYEEKCKYLFDFNEKLRELICSLLDIPLDKIIFSEEYISADNEEFLDFRENISPKVDWREADKRFVAISYYQVFEERYGFTANMSILDLLFNMGNESQIILGKSIKNVSD